MANSVTLTGTALPSSVPSDPSLCAISGYLRGIDGTPMRGTSVQVRYTYNPVGSGATVLHGGERTRFTTDSNGFLQMFLVQGVEAYLEIPNWHFDFVPHIYVPETSTANLLDVLLPRIGSVDFVTPTGTTIEEGEVLEVEVEATLTDGRVVALDGSSVELSSSNESILLRQSGMLFIGEAPGTVTLSVVSVSDSALGLMLMPDGTELTLPGVAAPTLPAAISIVVT